VRPRAITFSSFSSDSISDFDYRTVSNLTKIECETEKLIAQYFEDIRTPELTSTDSMGRYSKNDASS
jgi:hypothetical protein